MNKAIFLDRDGVINVDRPDYVYKPSHYKLISGVPESLNTLKENNYKLIVITNQSGIAKGIYTAEDMKNIHDIVQEDCGNLIDAFYYAPWHPSVSESLTRKPGTLMFERAIAKFNIDPAQSWMIGDKDRDLVPAKVFNIKTIQVDLNDSVTADHKALNLKEATSIILKD